MSIFDNVHKIVSNQEKKGKSKYGMSIDDAKFTPIQWMQHAQEELADAMVYLEALKNEWHNMQSQTNIKAITDKRTTAQVERDLIDEIMDRLTALQLSTIQTNGGLSFVDILRELENIKEETTG
jgi:IMP dehydrogenase/GMP reductase